MRSVVERFLRRCKRKKELAAPPIRIVELRMRTNQCIFCEDHLFMAIVPLTEKPETYEVAPVVETSNLRVWCVVNRDYVRID